MRILVLNWLDPTNPQAGGAEIHLRHTFGRLVDRGHHVTLLASGYPDAPTQEVVEGIQVHRTGGRHTFLLKAMPYYRRHLAGGGFDVLVEDLNKVPLFSPLWTDSPVVLLVHHLFGPTAFAEASVPVAALTWLLERPIPRVFEWVPTVAVSRSTADDLIYRGMPRERIEVIPNGVETDRYTPLEQGDRYPLPTVLYLGRLRRYKRVDLPIRAMGLLQERGVECRLLVAGKGEDRERLERQVREMGLGHCVEFLGFVSEERKLELFRRSWVHVLTSPKEGWGIANLEAAACGTPTVASRSPGLQDSVQDGSTGFLVPHGDVAALAARLQALLTRRHRVEAMGREARRFALEFSWDRTAERMERLLMKRVAESAATE